MLAPRARPGALGPGGQGGAHQLARTAAWRPGRAPGGGGTPPRTGLVTTSLAVDFLGRAELGQWLEVDTPFTQAGRRQGVAQAFVAADGVIIARANASFALA